MYEGVHYASKIRSRRQLVQEVRENEPHSLYSCEMPEDIEARFENELAAARRLATAREAALEV